MDKHNFEILSGDKLVAIYKNSELSVINGDLIPLFLKRLSAADKWLETRAIDSHRANSRLLKKALRLSEKDDISTVIRVNAATVIDNYWIRPIGSALRYSDIRYTDDYFSSLALKGTFNSFNHAANSARSRTPELTNIGSFEKCWKLKDGKWWMYKAASHDEMFSELFVYELGAALDMNMAIYEKDNNAIKTLDFTDGASKNFEPAFSFMGDNEDYIDVINALFDLCPDAVPDYIKMIFLDTVTANPDRHTHNFGILRDISNGRITGLAPNFDNNMALISRGYPSMPNKNDILIKLFNELLSEFPEMKQYIPKLTNDIVTGVIKKIGMRVKSQKITDLVIARYNLIERV